jgi:DUF971 family protein
MTISNVPSLIKLHQETALLEVAFAGGQKYMLPCEYLRVFSPSAEVRGHGRSPMSFEAGKRFVNIKSVDSVGNYAIKIQFDDGHSSGIYTWEMLYDLGVNQAAYWQRYIDYLKEDGLERDPVRN